jgi:hypothetical protein
MHGGSAELLVAVVESLVYGVSRHVQAARDLFLLKARQVSQLQDLPLARA